MSEVAQKASWGCWTDYSACSVTCGIGRRVRYRKCMSTNGDLTNEKDCEGSSSQDEICEMPSCDCKFIDSFVDVFSNICLTHFSIAWLV